MAELTNSSKCFAYEGYEAVLGMLRARQKVLIHHPAFHAKIGGKTEITVNLPIGAFYVLFLTPGIVENEAVEIKGNVTGGDCCQRNFRFLQKLD